MSTAPMIMAVHAWLHFQTPCPRVPFWDPLFPSTVPLEMEKAQTVTAVLSHLLGTAYVWGVLEGLCAAPCPWDLGKQ